MAEIIFPSLEEVLQRMQTDVQNELPESNPYLAQSYIKAVITGLAGRNFENFSQLNILLNDLYLTTTTDDFLTLWSSIYGLTQKNATQATGNITSTGVVGTVIPAGTILVNSETDQYQTELEVSIQFVSVSCTLNRTGSVVQATTINPHNFATGISVTISGAVSSEYNGIFEIIVLDDINFTYTITTTPATPDSGIVATNLASMTVISVEFGSDQNLDGGESLTFQSVIPGIDNNIAFVQHDGITGGQNTETNDEFRARLLFRTRNPVAQFSVSSIEEQCFLIQGVTRVFVQPIKPAVGSVTIFFVRDNDPIIIPTAEEVQQVRDSILLIYPASSDPVNLIVAAPIPIIVDFNFSVLLPNTSTMRSAVIANLQQFFKDSAGVDDDILELGYNSAIFSTIDPNTGDQVTSFTLSTPTGDIVIASDEIGILGDVSFN